MDRARAQRSESAGRGVKPNWLRGPSQTGAELHKYQERALSTALLLRMHSCYLEAWRLSSFGPYSINKPGLFKQLERFGLALRWPRRK